MKYVQPHGIADPEGHYVNGNPSTGVQGSIPPAEAFEHPMREIVGVIQKSFIPPASTDLLQMARAVRSQRSNFAEDTGSVNQLSVAYDPPLGAYTLGLLLRVRVRETNTGSSTINAGAGRVQIKRPDGNQVAAGDLPAGGLVDFAFDGSSFQMVNFQGRAAGGSVTNNFNQVPYSRDNSAVVNIIKANAFTPAITVAPKEGDAILVQINNTNTGPTTIEIHALPSRQVLFGTGQLLPGDIGKDEIKLLVFDGSAWQITPNNMIPASVTIPVPAAYPNANAALNALARKRIAPGAMVTIKMAEGVFGPIAVYHIDATRITIAGTMRSGQSYPTILDFTLTGNTDAARNHDADPNRAMLESKYGTIIEVEDDEIGITNLGPGEVHVKDILFKGNHVVDSSVAAKTLELFSIDMIGCAAWGVANGFFSNGYMKLYKCCATACGNAGFIGTHCSRLYVNECIGVSNKNGVQIDFFGRSQLVGGDFRYNGLYGIYAAYMAGVECYAINASSNKTYDLVSNRMSYVWVKDSTFFTANPVADGREGNLGSRIEEY